MQIADDHGEGQPQAIARKKEIHLLNSSRPDARLSTNSLPRGLLPPPSRLRWPNLILDHRFAFPITLFAAPAGAGPAFQRSRLSRPLLPGCPE